MHSYNLHLLAIYLFPEPTSNNSISLFTGCILKYLMRAYMFQYNLNHSSHDSFNFLIILVFPQQMFSSLLMSFKIRYLGLNTAFLRLSDQCRVQFAIASLQMYILLLLNRLKHLYFCLVLSFLILRLFFNSI